MDRIPQTSKGTFGMTCIKCMLILMNSLYLLISFLMISGATTLKIIFGEYYYTLWDASTVDSLSSLWIATGVCLLALSIFGIAAAIKESTMMTNLYGLLLSLIVILQIAAAITGFTLITRTDGIVWNSLNSMMSRGYWHSEYVTADKTMDWIQQTFQCCGNDGPGDWEDKGFGFRTTTESWTEPWTTEAWSEASTEEPIWDSSSTEYPDYSSTESSWDPSEYSSSAVIRNRRSTSEWFNYGYKTPQSCCEDGTNYDNEQFRCQRYYARGCRGPLQEIISESVMIVGSSALIIGVAQILGVVVAFTFARAIRRNKTNRDVRRWAIHESMGFDRPTYIDDRPSPNVDEIKHI